MTIYGNGRCALEDIRRALAVEWLDVLHRMERVPLKCSIAKHASNKLFSSRSLRASLYRTIDHAQVALPIPPAVRGVVSTLVEETHTSQRCELTTELGDS